MEYIWEELEGGREESKWCDCISIFKIQIKKKCRKDEFYNESTSGHW